MATVNPKFLKPIPARFVEAESTDALPDIPGVMAVIDGSLCVIAQGGMSTFAQEAFVERPVLESGELESDGVTINLTFSADVDGSDLDKALRVFVNGEQVELDTVEIDSGDKSLVTITVVDLILDTGIVWVSHNGTLLYSAGGELLVRPFHVRMTNDSLAAIPAPVAGAVVTAGDSTELTFKGGKLSSPEADLATGFTLLVDGEPVEITSAAYDGDTLVFEHDQILKDQAVTLSYDAETGDLVSEYDIVMPSFSDYEVTNASEAEVPVPVSAEVGESAVETAITFKGGAIESPGEDFKAGFMLLADGDPVAISAADFTSGSLVLEHAPILSGQEVTVSYDADVGDLVTEYGLVVGSFEDFAVENNSLAVTPALETATVVVSGLETTLTFAGGALVSPGEQLVLGWSLTADGDPVVIQGANFADGVLTVQHYPILAGQEVLLSYDDSTGDIQSEYGVVLPSFDDAEVTNESELVAPAPESASVDANGVATYVTFVGGDLESPGEQLVLGWTLTADGNPVSIQGATFSDGALTIDHDPILEGQVVTLSYDAGTGDIKSVYGVTMESFSDFEVENNSAQTE